MTHRSLGFPEETQLRTDVAALLHHAESGLHPSETLAARDCQAVCVVVVEILIERHSERKCAGVVAAAPKRVEMGSAGDVRSPCVEHSFLRKCEIDVESCRRARLWCVHHDADNLLTSLSLDRSRKFPFSRIVRDDDNFIDNRTDQYRSDYFPL